MLPIGGINAASMASLKGNLLPCDYGCARYLCAPQPHRQITDRLLVCYWPLASRSLGSFWLFSRSLNDIDISYKFAALASLIMQYFLALLLLACAAAQKPQLAQTPPMGWMSWEVFRCEVDCVAHPDTCINERLYK